MYNEHREWHRPLPAMALLDVIPDSNPRLRKTSRRVKHVDSKLRQLVEDMYETMVQNWGVGLAAIQVGAMKRLFIYEIPRREVRGYDTCHTADGPSGTGKERGEREEEESGSVEETERTPAENGGYTGDYTVCINPRIVAAEGAFIDDEGCLSKAGWIAKVERAYKITFQAYDMNMEKFERTVEGLEARCVQHEIDHLDGILFTDRALPDTLREIAEEESEGAESELAPADQEAETSSSETTEHAAGAGDH